MTLKTIPWDAADHLTSAERIAAYLDAAFEDGDPDLIRAVLGDVARAKGMIETPRQPDSAAPASTRRYRPKETPNSRL